MRGSRTSLSLLLLIVLAVPASAETFGPFYYRAGVEKTHVRFKTTFLVKGANVDVEECGEMVLNFKPSGDVQCSTEKPDKVQRRGKLLYVTTGYDTHLIDTTKHTLTLIDSGKPWLKDIPPGEVDWASSPMGH